MAFPEVNARASSIENTNVTSHTVTLPSGILPGDLLIVWFVADQNPSIDIPAGWIQLKQRGDGGANVKTILFYRDADGTEGATITVTTSLTQHSAHRAWRISGHDKQTSVALADSGGTSANPDSPVLGPSGGGKEFLWLAVYGADGANDATVYPTNYTDTFYLETASADPANSCSLGVAERKFGTDSENPSAFTIDASENWVATTIAIYPAPPPKVPTEPSGIITSRSLRTTGSIQFDGADTKVENTTAGGLDSSQFSMLAWIFLDSFGEGGQGRILCIDENRNVFRFRVDTTNSRLRFVATFTGDDGSWHSGTNSMATGRWFCVGLTYDGSNTTNDPVFYLLDTDTDISLSLIIATIIGTEPTGSLEAFNTGYCIGNEGNQLQTFDGRIAYVQYWTRILHKEELNQAAHFPGSINNELVLYLPLEKDGYDFSSNGNSGVETATALGLGPPQVFTPRRTLIAAPYPEIETPPLIIQKHRRVYQR